MIVADRPPVLWIATLVVASSVVIGILGWPPAAETNLAFPDALRDLARDRQAVGAAFGFDAPLPDHPRLPGALLLLSPILLVPVSYLTWIAAVTSVVAVVLMVEAQRRLSQSRWILIFALVIPTTIAFRQSILHGSMFPVVASFIVWSWVLAKDSKEGLAGVCLALAGLLRLWPLLCLVPFAFARKRKVVVVAIITFVTINALGLVITRMNVGDVVDNLMLSTRTWVPADHNGALARWIGPLSPFAPLAGAVIGLIVWWARFRRFRDLDGMLAWTLPLSILVSPVAWLPYLLATFPGVALFARSRFAVILAIPLILIQVTAYRLFPSQGWATLFSAALAALIVLHSTVRPPSAQPSAPSVASG